MGAGALPYPALPYPALPCLTLPYPTLTYPTLPYPTLTCPTLPYPTQDYGLSATQKLLQTSVGGKAADVLGMSPAAKASAMEKVLLVYRLLFLFSFLLLSSLELSDTQVYHP